MDMEKLKRAAAARAVEQVSDGMRFGLGTAARVRRREPGIVDRLVLVSESGQLHLSAAEKSPPSKPPPMPQLSINR